MSYYSENPLADGQPLRIRARQVEDTTAYGVAAANSGAGGDMSVRTEPGFHQVRDMNSLASSVLSHLLPYGTSLGSITPHDDRVEVTIKLNACEFGERKVVEQLIPYADTSEPITVKSLSAGEVQLSFPFPFPQYKATHLQTREELQETVHTWERRVSFFKEYGSWPQF